LRSQSVVDSYEVPSAVDLGVGVPANSTSKRYSVSLYGADSWQNFGTIAVK
jgi:hypothetical protein